MTRSAPPDRVRARLPRSYDQAHDATGTSTVSASASELPIPAVGRAAAPRPLFTFVRVVTLVAVAVLVFAAVGFVTTRMKTRHLAASLPEASADVHLKLTVVLPNALVSIDGAPVATPSDARFPRDGREHQVRVEAAGFEPHVESLQLDNDLAMSVVLTNVRPPAGKKPPRSERETGCQRVRKAPLNASQKRAQIASVPLT